MLSDKELATLHSTLEAPLAVIDVLRVGQALNDEEQTALLILFSQMSALDALVAMACCAQRMAASLGHDRPLASTLSINADFILNDYGPICLQQRKSGGNIADVWNIDIQEDLEAMADLFAVVQDSLLTGSPAIVSLCVFLRDQALAHAGALLDNIPKVAQETDILFDEPKTVDDAPFFYGGNVIPFPKIRRVN